MAKNLKLSASKWRLPPWVVGLVVVLLVGGIFALLFADKAVVGAAGGVLSLVLYLVGAMSGVGVDTSDTPSNGASAPDKEPTHLEPAETPEGGENQ